MGVHSNTGDFNPAQKIVTLSEVGATTVNFTITNIHLVPVTFDVVLANTTPKDAWVKLPEISTLQQTHHASRSAKFARQFLHSHDRTKRRSGIRRIHAPGRCVYWAFLHGRPGRSGCRSPNDLPCGQEYCRRPPNRSCAIRRQQRRATRS